MIKRSTLLLGLAFLAAGCDNEPADQANTIQLDWQAGEQFYVGASYRVANVRTEETPASLEGGDEPNFGEQWSNEVFWTYQVVETGLVPTSDDSLYDFSVKSDGTQAPLSVIRAWVDASLNPQEDLTEAAPVIYLVFREDRDRLAGLVSFSNVDGERVERAWSSQELGKSWSALSQSMLTSAPTYLAPFAATYDDESKVLENGSLLDTVPAGDGVVDVYYDDELGGGLVQSRYEVGQPWPSLTVTDNVEARLLSQDDIARRRAALPFLTPEDPEDFDFRAALRASLDIDKGIVLDSETMGGGWEATVTRRYQPWAGSWWNLRDAKHIFGYRSVGGNETFSDVFRSDLEPLKAEIEQIGEDLRDMDQSSSEYSTKVAAYKEKQEAFVDKIVEHYNGLLQGLQGGTITIADGKITKAGTDGWSFDLDNLSPYDKMAVAHYLDGQTNPNPFFIPGWATLNSWAANRSLDNSWWGYCNGWAGAAILEDEPRETVNVSVGGQTIEFSAADQKGLTTALHYSTTSRFYGSRYYKEGDDLADLSPKAFHQLISFYFREQGVPLVFDTTAKEAVWNYPAYGANVRVTETSEGAGKLNVNTASSAQLQTLPGIGEVKALAIISYRETYGPFQDIEDLVKVSGIGSATMDDIRDAVTVSAAQRSFHVCADVIFSTDGVGETHLDNPDAAPNGFTNQYCYTLETDADGRVAGQGTWDNEAEHPDFAWVPYDNPLGASQGGSENPYLSYQKYLDLVVDLRR